MAQMIQSFLRPPTILVRPDDTMGAIRLPINGESSVSLTELSLCPIVAKGLITEIARLSTRDKAKEVFAV
jgi:hypothetical protein